MKVLLHAYIGDLFAFDFFLADDVRAKVTNVVYNEQQALRTHDLIPHVFPNVTGLTICECKGLTKFSFEGASLAQLQEFFPQLNDAFDLRWPHTFWTPTNPAPTAITKGSFLTKKLADISRIELPAEFIALHPYSSWSHQPNRDFSPVDLLAVQQFSKKSKLPVVLLGQRAALAKNSQFRRTKKHTWQLATDQLAADSGWVNLMDETTMFETIEILKRASCFVGASSCLSILAAAYFPEPRLFVKMDDNFYALPTFMKYFYPYATAAIRCSRPLIIADFDRFDGYTS